MPESLERRTKEWFLSSLTDLGLGLAPHNAIPATSLAPGILQSNKYQMFSHLLHHVCQTSQAPPSTYTELEFKQPVSVSAAVWFNIFSTKVPQGAFQKTSC